MYREVVRRCQRLVDETSGADQSRMTLGDQPTRERPAVEHLWRAHLRWYELAPWIGLAGGTLGYRIAIAARERFWRRWRRRSPVRTVSVGNLTVGGNGKTPFTLFLANRLAEQGLKGGIVSRGYGGTIEARAALVSDGHQIRLSIKEAGDEPVMMAKSFAGPIAVARRRIDGIELLRTTANLDLVVLDDA